MVHCGRGFLSVGSKEKVFAVPLSGETVTGERGFLGEMRPSPYATDDFHGLLVDKSEEHVSFRLTSTMMD